MGGEEGAIIQCSARDELWNVNRSGYDVNGRRKNPGFSTFFQRVFRSNWPRLTAFKSSAGIPC